MRIHCDTDADGLITVEAAYDTILTHTPELDGVIEQSAQLALGHVAAQDHRSPIQVPGFDNASMDGYAFAYQSYLNGPLRLAGESRAGHAPDTALAPGTAIRIFTGAALPLGADTVVMQEQCTEGDGVLTIQGAVKAGQYCRLAGSDIQHDDVIIPAGTVISAAHIALMAACGETTINSKPTPSVGILSTGDELISPGQALVHGQIYDSNRPSLAALLNTLNVNVIDLGRVKDDANTVEEQIAAAAHNCDVLITSGGASVGDADHIHSALAKLGQVQMWRIAMKPGKPLVFGKIRECLFFGLPGNPVSTIVTFLLFVRPSLLKMGGYPESQWHLNKQTATLDSSIQRKAGRQEYQRGNFYQGEAGLVVTPLSGQESHNLLTFSQANCLIEIPAPVSALNTGDRVKVVPLHRLLY